VIEPLEEIAVSSKNENACATLGLLGSFEAARALDRIRKAFRVKYPNVREAAQEAFAGIAEALGKTPFELSDAMIPDFGFKDGRLPFPVGQEKLALVLTSERKLGIVDATGKALKALPKTTPEKEKAGFKELGKAVQEAARQLGSNLEYYLIVQRRWPAADWQTFFTGNPLAAAFASGLVWAMYDGNSLKVTFRAQPDGRLLDLEGKAVALHKDAIIGLVHPLEVAPTERAAWQAALVKAGASVPFAQMERPVHTASGEDRERTLSFAFEDQTVNAATFKGRAERLGWRRGSVIDSGEVSSFRKNWPNDKLETFLRLEGLGVQGFDYESEATLKDFFFVKAGSIVTGSYTYDEPNDAGDERLLKLGAVPPIVYSETLADLHAITKKKSQGDED
jgi:hypothetical protein